MKLRSGPWTWLVCLPCLLAAPLLAQPQIGGGTCNSATLSGTYSITLSGRDLSSAVAFSGISDSVGTAIFDGLSKVTFTLTNNTNKATGVPLTQSGTYSLQSNCIGVVNITTGDTASYVLGSYNQGKSYFLTGQNGTYSLLGSGTTMPASCTAGTFTGVFAFNGNGDALTSGAVTGVNNISGLLTFDGTNAVTGTWYITGTTAATATSGTYAITSSCTATATIKDSAGNTYALVFTITSAAGNFLITGASPQLIFTGNGRPL